MKKHIVVKNKWDRKKAERAKASGAEAVEEENPLTGRQDAAIAPRPVRMTSKVGAASFESK
jgi:hypothetical protein